MKVPPLVLHLTVVSPRRRPMRLWLPLVLLWPLALVLGALALVLGALALVVAVVTDGLLLALGRRYHHYTILLVRSLAALCETRGTVIRFSNATTAVDMTVH
jgi:hypothetical protein